MDSVLGRTIVRAPVVLAVLTVAACGSPPESGVPGSLDRPASTAPQASSSASIVENADPCDLAAEIALPEWLPPDLPLPDGTYAFEESGPDSGYYYAGFILPMSTDEFGDFVRNEWPSAGYTLGRGDSEPWEVEAIFGKPPAIGQFKANLLQCTPARSRLSLRWAPEGLATPAP